MPIDSNLDGGSIVVVDDKKLSRIELALRSDTANDMFRQWFHFRHRGAKGKASTYRIDTSGSTYPNALEGYRAAASYDLEEWFRVPTSSEDGALTIKHTPTRDAVHYAYFAAYPFARHEQLIVRAN